MKHLNLFVILVFIFILIGCDGKKSSVVQNAEPPKPPAIVVPEKKPEVIYRYGGEIYRDPFIPLTGKHIISPVLEASGEAENPSFGVLTLKGISIDSNCKIALFSSPIGTFILKNGKLFDNRNRVVKTITGSVEGRSATLTTADKYSKTFKLPGSE